MGSKPLTIEAIKKAVHQTAEKYGVDKIYLFGSYARGEATLESDIDLHIEKGRIADLIALSEFQIELESTLETHVDLLTTGSLDEAFLKRIKREEILIYEH